VGKSSILVVLLAVFADCRTQRLDALTP